jgi:hypothetical protein
MYKVTLKFGLVLLAGCFHARSEADMIIYEQQLNKVTEARIDSAYRAIHEQCDSLVEWVVPLIADSLARLTKTK